MREEEEATEKRVGRAGWGKEMQIRIGWKEDEYMEGIKIGKRKMIGDRKCKKRI